MKPFIGTIADASAGSSGCVVMNGWAAEAFVEGCTIGKQAISRPLQNH
jgi:hypothetical protein